MKAYILVNETGAVEQVWPRPLITIFGEHIPTRAGRGDDATCFSMGCVLVLTQPVEWNIWRSGFSETDGGEKRDFGI